MENDLTTADVPSPFPGEIDTLPSRLPRLLCALSICMGLVPALCGDSYQGDAISYLDMGDAFFAGDRWAIVNGLWSPLFPFLHGFSRWIFKPAMRWEPSLVQFANLLIYTSTVFSFHFFWLEVLRLYRRTSGGRTQLEFAVFSDSEFWLFGYALFLFLHLHLFAVMTPDMLLATFVYLVAALILRMQRAGALLSRFALLGALLGLGFLTKAIMLPLAPLFLAAAILPLGRQKRLLSGAFLALLTFCAVTGPYVLALSKKLGHFTMGEAGALNYAWHVNGAVFVHWQGDPPELGKPLHPTRLVFKSPPIYEFALPFQATYPPWYDPSYWNAGLHPRFRWSDQMEALRGMFGQYLRELWSQAIFITGVLILLTMRLRLRATFRELCEVWYLWVPAIAALLLYGLIWIEARYVAQFFVLFWAACLALVRLPNTNDSRRLLRATLVVVVGLMGIRVTVHLMSDSVRGHRNAKEQMYIAESLAEQGVQREEKIAFLGSLPGTWQKLLRVHIVAEADDENFCVTDAAKWREIDTVLLRAGARVFIGEFLNSSCTAGWQEVGKTSIYVHHFNEWHSGTDRTPAPTDISEQPLSR